MTLDKAVRGRFEARVRIGLPDECWPWLGGHDADGRGRFWLDGRNLNAPRVALMLAGIPVPPSSFVCHTCDNPACVNPKHLYVGDAFSNVHDMLDRGRNRSKGIPRIAARGEKNHNAKLSDRQVSEIRCRYVGRRGEQTMLAREYGVTQALISLIVAGEYRDSI